MIILSWDVGIIHLAYCLLEKKEDGSIRNLDWNNIDLTNEEKKTCLGTNKSGKICGKTATYQQVVQGEEYLYCKTHLSQSEENYDFEEIEGTFKNISKGVCNHQKTTGDLCGAKARYRCQGDLFCLAHYRSVLHKKKKAVLPILLKSRSSNNHSTSSLQLSLARKIDSLLPHFSKLGVEEVIIENQPAHKNPRMKAIACCLYDVFMVRGLIDKRIPIHNVRYICPSNKLKVDENNTLIVLKNTKGKEKYKMTKQLGIEYTKKLLSDDQPNLDFLNTFKKKDDLCDAYLQGRYYLEYCQ